MTKLILSTGNVMTGGPSIIRRSGLNRSNQELVNSLRGNFASAQEDYASEGNGDGNAGQTRRAAVEAWTEQDGDTLFIPRIDWQGAGLQDNADQYEITVKLFLLEGTPAQQREIYIKEALALVSKQLGTSCIDLLVLSFPNLSFEGTCEMEADRINAQQGDLDEEIETWKVAEGLQKQGLVKLLGVAEFGSQKLRAFMQRSTVHPAVDQINLKDCCSVPAPLKQLADEAGIELNVHTDSTDVLPKGTLRELLGQESNGAGVLADSGQGGKGLFGEIVPQWVVKYTALVRDRGVVENKGYFAGANLQAQ